MDVISPQPEIDGEAGSYEKEVVGDALAALGEEGEKNEDWNFSMDDFNNIAAQHAQHVTAVTSQATTAAWHADVAATQAASLAQWVQYLWGQVATLQHKVKDLEDWKKKALEDMGKLRAEHKNLRNKLYVVDTENDDIPSVSKAKSLPNFDSRGDGDTTPSDGEVMAQRKPAKAMTVAMGPPPGLEAALDESPLEGVFVERVVVDSQDCEKAEWRIGNLTAKLKTCMGRALVSSPFSAWGMDDLRLMVFPDGKEVARGPRSKRHKDLYSKKVSEGPLDACLKLKVPDCPAPHILEYYLKIGSVRKGPFKHNFEESTVNGCSDFGIDWLKQVDADQSLKVTVEILQMKP